MPRILGFFFFSGEARAVEASAGRCSMGGEVTSHSSATAVSGSLPSSVSGVSATYTSHTTFRCGLPTVSREIHDKQKSLKLKAFFNKICRPHGCKKCSILHFIHRDMPSGVAAPWTCPAGGRGAKIEMTLCSITCNNFMLSMLITYYTALIRIVIVNEVICILSSSTAKQKKLTTNR